ncbi:hypothetical protein YC2023_117539 [Brassica napus]
MFRTKTGSFTMKKTELIQAHGTRGGATWQGGGSADPGDFRVSRLAVDDLHGSLLVNAEGCAPDRATTGSDHGHSQGGYLVNQIDPIEVLPSDFAEHTTRVIPSDHSIHTDHVFPSERADQTICTVPSDHPDRTARADHRIDPQTCGMELRLQPRPSDGIDRSISLISQPIQHYKTDGRA